jgi:hypothetical protein
MQGQPRNCNFVEPEDSVPRKTSHWWSIFWARLSQSKCSYPISFRQFWCYFPTCFWVIRTVSFLQNFLQNLLFHICHILLEIKILIIIGTSKEIKLFKARVHKLPGARSLGSFSYVPWCAVCCVFSVDLPNLLAPMILRRIPDIW